MDKVQDVIVGETIVRNIFFTETIIQGILLLFFSFLAPMVILKG
jgi:hypothetical protein